MSPADAKSRSLSGDAKAMLKRLQAQGLELARPTSGDEEGLSGAARAQLAAMRSQGLAANESAEETPAPPASKLDLARYRGLADKIKGKVARGLEGDPRDTQDVWLRRLMRLFFRLSGLGAPNFSRPRYVREASGSVVSTLVLRFVSLLLVLVVPAVANTQFFIPQISENRSLNDRVPTMEADLAAAVGRIATLQNDLVARSEKLAEIEKRVSTSARRKSAISRAFALIESQGGRVLGYNVRNSAEAEAQKTEDGDAPATFLIDIPQSDGTTDYMMSLTASYPAWLAARRNVIDELGAINVPFERITLPEGASLVRIDTVFRFMTVSGE